MNLRPSGYEPDELPDCSTPRHRQTAAFAWRSPPFVRVKHRKEEFSTLRRPGNGLLSQVLRHSTIGARAFDGRVRDGIGSDRSAKVTRPAKGEKEANFFGACTHPNDADDTGLAKVLYDFAHALSRRHRTHGHRVMRAFKPIELLVPVSSTPCGASTPGLSTWSSSTALEGELV